MTFTTNRIFIDSSVLLEAFKGNKVDFYNRLIFNIDNSFYINEIVLSEYLYYVLAITAATSPRTIKEKGNIPTVLNSISIETLIPQDFILLPSTSLYFDLVPKVMIKYNMLSNDAIILAACIVHDIKTLASHDTDFIIPCKAEGIELLREE